MSTPLELADRQVPEHHLAWHRISVDGKEAVYGVGGQGGPPIVFLHGWALGSHAYKRAINRLVARGCQVFAPTLPSFGGTEDLAASETNLDGYARWVASFMDVVGISEPALVIGHSFGGGVAIKLAQSRPDLVSYLALLNAVGAVASRPFWEWVAGFGRDLWPPNVAWEVMAAVRSDLMPNLLRNPCGVMKVAVLAQRADLRRESAELRDRGLPVLVLTSEGDNVIPRGAFETLCSAIGSDGRVVSGGHSWLLADPDSFGAALAPVVDLRVTEHRSSRAATRVGELAELLADNHIPDETIQALLEDAPPLWLISERAAVLAGDLLLCYPALRRHEVRAVARPVEGSPAVRLTIAAADRRGLLADSATVLASSGMSISEASAATWSKYGLALHSFGVVGDLDDEAWSALGQKLKLMASTRSLPSSIPVQPLKVTVHGGEQDHMMVTVTARDEVGVLAGLCRTFADGGVNIESVHATTANGVARDTFLVSGAPDGESVHRILSQPGSGPPRVKGPTRARASRAAGAASRRPLLSALPPSP